MRYLCKNKKSPLLDLKAFMIIAYIFIIANTRFSKQTLSGIAHAGLFLDLDHDVHDIRMELRSLVVFQFFDGCG